MPFQKSFSAATTSSAPASPMDLALVSTVQPPAQRGPLAVLIWGLAQLQRHEHSDVRLDGQIPLPGPSKMFALEFTENFSRSLVSMVSGTIEIDCLRRFNYPSSDPTLASYGLRGKAKQHCGGESVSQSLLKDKAFSTFLDQNLPFELPEKGISRSTKGCPAQWSVIDISAIKRLAKGKFRRTARPDRRQSRNLIVAHPGSGPALQFPSAVDVTKEPCADDLPTALRTAGRHVSHGCARSRLSMWPSELRIRR
jgi:hypothetical protein